MTPSALDVVWALQGRWSRVATEQRARVDRRRRANLALLFVGASAGATATVGIEGVAVQIAAGVSALALSLAAAVQQRGLNATEISQWSAARKASEAIKAEAYRYLAQVPPYRGADRDERLLDRVEDHENDARDHVVALNATASDRADAPDISGIDDYVRLRATEQAGWHRRKRAEHERTAGVWRRVELGITLVGAVVSAFGGIAGEGAAGVAGAIVGVTTTLAAMVAAHLAATGHERIAAGYAATSERLERLVVRLPEHPTEEQAVAFVEDVEELLARQNESWVGLFTRAGS
ncbi:MAG: DUF4231 domain-containing protein [Actinomycetota bacterium]|nr:DUF4231 domain-containing protein [Actinomycetota bacterium]